MIVGIKVDGVKEKNKLSFKEEKEQLLKVSYFMLRDVMENERDNVMMMLMSGFKRLRYEELEEVYSDGCLLLWEKMMDDDYELRKESISGFLRRVCWNIGRHYLRRINDNVVSLDMMMGRGDECISEKSGIGELFDVVEECDDNDVRYEKLDEIWERLSEVDKMILESYYVDGCEMKEIARRIGYKNGNSVKSRKNKVLKKIIEIRKEKEADCESQPLAA